MNPSNFLLKNLFSQFFYIYIIVNNISLLFIFCNNIGDLWWINFFLVETLVSNFLYFHWYIYKKDRRKLLAAILFAKVGDERREMKNA
jgi:hypothetical protein